MRRSLHVTRASASISRFAPGRRKRSRTCETGRERAHRADADAALAEVEREHGRDGVAEPVRHRDAEHDARAGPAVEVVGEQVRRERRQDVLRRAVLVDVAGDAERRQLPDLFGAADRPAEDEDGQAAAVEFADGAHQLDAGREREPQVEHEEVDLREVGAVTRPAAPPRSSRPRPDAPRPASAVWNRSRTNVASSAIRTVLAGGGSGGHRSVVSEGTARDVRAGPAAPPTGERRVAPRLRTAIESRYNPTPS